MIVLVTGGARSGKSTWAENRLAECRRKVYLATAPVCDPEFAERIRIHRERRAGKGWINIEDQTDPASAIGKVLDSDGILIDCLTLWINNLLYHGIVKNETDMARETDKLLSALSGYGGTAVLVINEVGLGIVPENALARLFRDCCGRCSQRVAAAAGEVVLTVCGIPVRVK